MDTQKSHDDGGLITLKKNLEDIIYILDPLSSYKKHIMDDSLTLKCSCGVYVHYTNNYSVEVIGINNLRLTLIVNG